MAVLISVIVPVYNVEPYLRKCLDSIVGQTYSDLEILIIDDGSTDGSGKICDEYAAQYERIQVFHTENKGLSCARNLGLDNANGDWIGFVDSDDWIELDMYEALIRKAKETGADIVECGVLTEYTTRTIKSPAINDTVSDTEALDALIKGSIRTQVWNKIYRSSLFYTIRFPDGQAYEDISTTYKLLVSSRVTGIVPFAYHYIQRESGISQKHDIRNLIDYWNAHQQRYMDLHGIVDEELLLQSCAAAIGRTWAWYLKADAQPAFVSEISKFARKHFSLYGIKAWPLYLKISVLLARFNNRLSFSIAYAMNKMYRSLKPKYYV